MREWYTKNLDKDNKWENILKSNPSRDELESRIYELKKIISPLPISDNVINELMILIQNEKNKFLAFIDDEYSDGRFTKNFIVKKDDVRDFVGVEIWNLLQTEEFVWYVYDKIAKEFNNIYSIKKKYPNHRFTKFKLFKGIAEKAYQNEMENALKTERITSYDDFEPHGVGTYLFKYPKDSLGIEYYKNLLKRYKEKLRAYNL